MAVGRLHADPNAKNKFGFTPLDLAAGCTTPKTDAVELGGPNSYLTIRAILRHGAHKDVKDKNGRTALHWAKKLENQGPSRR